jgi:AraC family transcriptional regulator
MRRQPDPLRKSAKGQETVRQILVGAEDVLPSQHVWYEGRGYSIYAAEQPRSSWQEHTHDCVQVTIGLEPAHVQATWSNDSLSHGQRELSGNMISIIPPGEPHSTLWQRRAILIHLYLSKTLLEDVASELPRTPTSELRPVYLVRDLFLEELGRTLFRECHGEAPGKLFADSAVKVLIAYLLRNYGFHPEAATVVPGGLGPARERRVREHIERHLERDLSIKVLARVLEMNPQYFANAFRLTTGFTPHRYVSHRRVARAQQLLADTELSLTDIAYQCGFKSQSQFTTVFRNFTGMTPGRFRSRRVAPKRPDLGPGVGVDDSGW